MGYLFFFLMIRRPPRSTLFPYTSSSDLELRRSIADAIFVVGGDHEERTFRPGHGRVELEPDRKSTRLNSSHGYISYAVFCLKKKNYITIHNVDRITSISPQHSSSPLQTT